MIIPIYQLPAMTVYIYRKDRESKLLLRQPSKAELEFHIQLPAQIAQSPSRK